MKYNPDYTCWLQGATVVPRSRWLRRLGRRQRALDSTRRRTAVRRRPVPLSRTTCPMSRPRAGPADSRAADRCPMRRRTSQCASSITDTGFGTGLDVRPNPGIGHPGYADYLPVTRAVPEPPKIRRAYRGPRQARSPIRVRRPTAPRSTDRKASRCGRACHRPNPTACPRPRHHPVIIETAREDGQAVKDDFKGAAWRLAVFLTVVRSARFCC